MVDENLLQGLVALPPPPRGARSGSVPSSGRYSGNKEVPATDNTPRYEPFCNATTLGFDSLELLVRFITLTCVRRRHPGDRKENNGHWRPFQAYFPRVTRFMLSLDIFQSGRVGSWGTVDVWEQLVGAVKGKTVVELILRSGQAVMTPEWDGDNVVSARIAWMLRLTPIPHTLRVIFCDSGPLQPLNNPSMWLPPPAGLNALPLRVVLSVLSIGRGLDSETDEEGVYEWVVEGTKVLKERVKWEIDMIPHDADRKETLHVFKKKCTFVEMRRRR